MNNDAYRDWLRTMTYQELLEESCLRIGNLSTSGLVHLVELCHAEMKWRNVEMDKEKILTAVAGSLGA